MGSSKVYSVSECQMNLQDGVSNLLWFIGQATRFERDNGLAWYRKAYLDCVELSERYNLPLTRVILVVACLSPQTRWSQNVLIAEIVIRYYLSSGYVPNYADYKGNGGTHSLVELSRNGALIKIPANVTGSNLIKALWILQGHDNVLSGQKVESFFDNLIRFGDSNKVTVDSHAILSWFKSVDKQSVSCAPSFYGIIETDYRKVAEIIGVSPLECQAIVWIVRRRLAGSDQTDGFGVQVLIDFLASMPNVVK